MTQESATIEGYEPTPLHANHIDMCKFSSEKDENYRLVADRLKEWAKEIDRTKKPGAPGIVSKLLVLGMVLRHAYSFQGDPV